MLVLTRRIRESVILEGFDDLACMLKVTVIEVRGGMVRLGFDCPASIAVHRLEVWARIRAESHEKYSSLPSRGRRFGRAQQP